MRYLSRREVVQLHERVIAASGGSAGIRDPGALESSLAQPRQTYFGADLYPDLVDKAAALGFFIVRNHPFVDGNKRTGQLAMEEFLLRNGYEIAAAVDEQEEVILALAAGQLSREEFTEWLRGHVVER